MWVSQHVTNEEVSVCEAAAVLVIADCPDECAACTPEGAGCTTSTDVNVIVKYDVNSLHNLGSDGGNPVLTAVGLMMVVVGFVGLVASRARNRRSAANAGDDALLVEDDLTAADA